MAAVRRPTGAFVASSVARQFDNLPAGDIHYVDVIVIVGPAPTEGEELSIGCPGGIDEVALVRQIEIRGVSAVGVHQIQLGNTGAIADEGDGLSSLWIPGRGSAGTISEGKALEIPAACVDGIEFGIAAHRR